MKKVALILVFILLSAAVYAETCFTIVNTPQNENQYWKAISYDKILESKFSNADWLSKTGSTDTSSGLGSGYQYNINVVSDCFNGYLLSNVENTGIDSGTMTIQEHIDDYFYHTPQGRYYTISIPDIDSVSNGLVSGAQTGPIAGINYLGKPNFDTNSPYTLLFDGICNDNIKIRYQMDKIIGEVFKELEPSTDSLDCRDHTNIIDCAIDNKKGDSAVYATIVAVAARDCGIPARVIYGIAEGSFDGVDIKFNSNKKQYWVEYYDAGWYAVDTDENTLNVHIENNCIDSEDNDDDGLKDCKDKDCKDRLFCQGAYPITSKFDNQYSTDISKLSNAYNINNLKLGNGFGSIQWQDQGLDLRDKDLDLGVEISVNRAEIISIIDELDAPAVVTLNDISLVDPEIFRNGISCSMCEIIDYDNDVIIFSIPGAGLYSTNQDIISDFNQTQINQTDFLPDIPEDAANEAEGFMKVWNVFIQYWDKFWALSTLWKIIIIGGLVVGYWFLFKRR